MSNKVVETLKVLGLFLKNNRSDIFLLLGLIGVGVWVSISFGLELCLLYVSSLLIFSSLVSSISDKKEEKKQNNRYY